MTMEWQNIETAPKNPEGKVSGPRVLVWDKRSLKIVHAFWTTAYLNNQLTTGWAAWSGSGAEYPLLTHHITHWIPLPELPT